MNSRNQLVPARKERKGKGKGKGKGKQCKLQKNTQYDIASRGKPGKQH